MSAPDDASDLWDRPPGPHVHCHGCREWAEDYDGGWCWRCCHASATIRVTWTPGAGLGGRVPARGADR